MLKISFLLFGLFVCFFLICLFPVSEQGGGEVVEESLAGIGEFLEHFYDDFSPTM